jgi:tetratricopeptide (TPR) repeat protein
MSRKRLSKKQLRRDKFVEQTFDWAHWLETHKQQALIALAGVVVLAGGFFIWRQMSQSAEETASVEYMTARQAYFAGNWQLATSDLQAFLSRYGNSSFADDAAFFVADAYYQSGQYPQAVQALETFVRDHEDSPFATNARSLLGATYQQLGEHDQATTVYRNALEDANSDADKIAFRQALARAYRAQGDVEAAANQYRAIVELDPEGEEGRETRRELAEITAQPISVAGPTAPDTSPADTASQNTQ